ncbi:hypothetical protein JTB14_023234 [Gonioctena quinquepunctata]|nr:hypothetical protein JTB14_023234 [Gonioctena quinquepunctata]
MDEIKEEFPILNEKMHLMIWQYEKDLWKELTEECYHPTSEQGKYLNKYPNKYSRGEKILHKNFDIMKNSEDSDFEELIGGSYEGEQYILLKNLAFIERNKGPSDKNHEIASNIINKEFFFRRKENRSLMRLITDVIEKNPGAIAETINPFYMEKLLEILDKMKELDPMNHALFIKNKPIPLPKVKVVNIGRTLPVALQGELSPEWKELADMIKAEKREKEKRDAVKKRERERMAELSRKHQSMEVPPPSSNPPAMKQKIIIEPLYVAEKVILSPIREESIENLGSSEKMEIDAEKGQAAGVTITPKGADAPPPPLLDSKGKKETTKPFTRKQLKDMREKIELVLDSDVPFRDVLEEEYLSPLYKYMKEIIKSENPRLGRALHEEEYYFINYVKDTPSVYEGESSPNDEQSLRAKETLEKLKKQTEMYGKNQIKERGEAEVSRTPQSMDALPPPSTPAEENNYEDEYFTHLSKSEDEDEMSANVSSEKFKETTKILEKIKEKQKDGKSKEVPIILAQTDGPTDRSSDDPSYGSTDEN